MTQHGIFMFLASACVSCVGTLIGCMTMNWAVEQLRRRRKRSEK
jgi:hypothetical protein